MPTHSWKSIHVRHPAQRTFDCHDHARLEDG